jgi:hypothetical protein
MIQTLLTEVLLSYLETTFVIACHLLDSLLNPTTWSPPSSSNWTPQEHLLSSSWPRGPPLTLHSDLFHLGETLAVTFLGSLLLMSS